MNPIDPQTYRLVCDGCRGDVLLYAASLYRYGRGDHAHLVGLCPVCRPVYADQIQREGYQAVGMEAITGEEQQP